MRITLANPLWRRAIFAFTCLIFIATTLVSGRLWLADYYANSDRSGDLQRAANLEPGNGDYWYRLGFASKWDMSSLDMSSAIGYFRHAAEIDPRAATYWMDLGDVYALQGQPAAARDAFQHALAAYPASAEVHWRYGTFLLQQGETRAAFAEIAPALKTDPKLVPLAITRVWAATQSTDVLLGVLPDTEDAQMQALDWFCEVQLVDPALATWNHMIGQKRSLPIDTVFPLENILLEANRGADAENAWESALIASGRTEELTERTQTNNLMFNGGFEFDSANGGLDWRLNNIRGINYSYDSTKPRFGKRSLRITFDGSQNFDFGGVWQDVPVQPNTHYRFLGFLRTAGLSTDSGIRFLISFPGTSQPNIVLANLTGDNDWQPETADIITSPDAHRIRVNLYRAASQRYENKLEGTAWVDGVELQAQGPNR
jgi:hypothetical protein